MKMRIIVETPLLPDLIKAYLENDALDSERTLNDEDVLVDATLETRSQEPDKLNILAIPLTNLLNEYLNLYEPATEENSYFDEEDELGSIIHEIISTIVELIPTANKVEMLTDEATSLIIYCGEIE